MAINDDFGRSVFINCPFDSDYAPLLESAVFCVVYFGFIPRLANESLEAGQSRLEKILQLIQSCRYSIHDLSRGKSNAAGEFARMNMPFELGLDFGYRRSGVADTKKFLIFERDPYDLKRSLSDLAGQDVEFHRNDYELVVKKVRDFFRIEGGVNPPGATRLISDYATFQGWMSEKKIQEGHSSADALTLPTGERIDEMKNWNALGRPIEFTVV